MRTQCVVVAPGESLWSIAQRSAAAGESTADAVAAIRAANPELSQGRPLRVGERLRVPEGS
jgi:Tfp pilus assembly protein FimV